MVQNLGPLETFAHPMDRAEVLHTLSHDIELSWKNTPGKVKFVKLFENLIFSLKKYTIVPPWWPLNMPGAV